jgi:hypothetical protein
MSQYPTHHLNNPVDKQTQCRTLPYSYKSNKQKPTIKKKLNVPIEYKTKQRQRTSSTHVQNALRQTMDDAIYICKITTNPFF